MVQPVSGKLYELLVDGNSKAAIQFFRSKTCPQCRARCDDRQVRRLYFSAALNSSMVDVDSLQVDLDDLKLEMRNLNGELDAKKTEIKRLRSRQEETKLALIGLEAELKLAKVQLQNALSQIASNKSELDRLRAVEKELNEKTDELKNLDYIKSVIESESVGKDVAEVLRNNPDPKALATIVSSLKAFVFPFSNDIRLHFTFTFSSFVSLFLVR